MKTIIKSYPAYDVIEAKTNMYGIKELHSGQTLVQCNRRLTGDAKHQHLNKFMISSVASSAIERNDCPIKAIERAKTHGHDLHFIFALGSTLTSHKQERKEHIEVAIGDRVYFEGHLFEIEGANNQNLRLKELESEGHSLTTIREVA